MRRPGIGARGPDRRSCMKTCQAVTRFTASASGMRSGGDAAIIGVPVHGDRAQDGFRRPCPDLWRSGGLRSIGGPSAQWLSGRRVAGGNLTRRNEPKG